MPSLNPPDGWLAANANDPTTDLSGSWWTSKIDIDEDNFESGDASVIFKPATSGTVYLISKDPIPVLAGQRLKARARVMNDIMSVSQSLFRLGIAFYDSDDTYIDIVERDSYGITFTALEDIWTTLTTEANVDDFSGAAYARTVIGRASTSGDTNTLWCDTADIYVEPDYQAFVRSSSASSLADHDPIPFDTMEVTAGGLYLDSSGRAVIIEGGTYVVLGEAELTMTNAQAGLISLVKGVWAGTLSLQTFAIGSEQWFVTGNLNRFCQVMGIERFSAGDLIEMCVSGTSTFNVTAGAKLRAVRISA